MAAEARFISDLESVDTTHLSDRARFERDVALHGARLRHFDDEVVRGWERRASASHEIGDALFLLLARDFAPLDERLDSMTQRLEAVPAALRQARDRTGQPPGALLERAGSRRRGGPADAGPRDRHGRPGALACREPAARAPGVRGARHT